MLKSSAVCEEFQMWWRKGYGRSLVDLRRSNSVTTVLDALCAESQSTAEKHIWDHRSTHFVMYRGKQIDAMLSVARYGYFGGCLFQLTAGLATLVIENPLPVV